MLLVGESTLGVLHAIRKKNEIMSCVLFLKNFGVDNLVQIQDRSFCFVDQSAMA